MKSKEEIEALFEPMRKSRDEYLAQHGDTVEMRIKHDMEVAPMTTSAKMVEMIGVDATVACESDLRRVVDALSVWNIRIEGLPENITPKFCKVFSEMLSDHVRMVPPCDDMVEFLDFSKYKEDEQ